MKTFAVEGHSTASLDEAMASAMAQAATLAAGAERFEIAVSAAFQDADGTFRVSISVMAHEETDELTPEAEADEDEGGEGEGRENARQHRRAEEISQQLKENIMHQFLHSHLGDAGPDNMADAYGEGREMVEHASPDTNMYVQDMEAATQSRDEDGDVDIDPLFVKPSSDEATFDVVQEAPDAAHTAAREAGGPAPESARLNVAVLSREVDDVIGLLSLGFYEPPRPQENASVRVEDEEAPPEDTPPTYIHRVAGATHAPAEEPVPEPQ